MSDTEKETGIKTVEEKRQPLYSYGDQALASHELSDVCCLSKGIPKRAVASDVNLRDGFNRRDYYSDRSGEQLPTKHSKIMLSCQAVYRKVGMIRNIIDLMTDFAVEDLGLKHPIKTQERFYREWGRRVKLQDRAHDFAKLLLRDANTIVFRKNAKITKPIVKEMTRAGIVNITGLDESVVQDIPETIPKTVKTTGKMQIPWRYVFLSPAIIEKTGGEVGKFFGADSLAMRIPASLANSIKNPRTKAEKEFVSKLPTKVVVAVNSGSHLVQLDMNEIYVDYYKKDDWEDWGTPFLYGILEDIMFKEKMRLADMAALDGVINVVRLWKLGNSDKQILPTQAAVDKLIGILECNTGGGCMDLVWDDMIDLKVEYPPTDKILGPEKYKSVNTDIVRGLGIPDSLIGGSDMGTRNAQSAFVQLKTLVERLEYIRDKVTTWIEHEMRLVADAMGFKHTPRISFGNMSLRDEAAEKQLIVNMLDRGVISYERAAEVFDVDYMIELERMKAEQKIRDQNPGLLEKSDPYHRPFSVMEKQNELAIELEKVKQQLNRASDDKGGGDNPLGDQPRDDGDNQPGRPPSTKDTSPRDERTPKTQSVLQALGMKFIDQLNDIFDPIFLSQKGIKNMRSLTKRQRAELEGAKRSMLAVLRGDDIPTKALITERMRDYGQLRRESASKLESEFNLLMSDFTAVTGQNPNIQDRKVLAAAAWSTVFGLGLNWKKPLAV